MKVSKMFFWLFLIIVGLVLFKSCKKDSSEELGKQNTPLYSVSSIPDPFFNLRFTHDSLNLGFARDGYYNYLDNVITHIQSNFQSTLLFANLKNNNIYPCWYCGEPEYFGYPNFYVPFYNLEKNELHGLLVIQEKNSVKKYYYLAKNLTDEIAAQREEPYSTYWSKIMEYFEDGVGGKDKKDYFESRALGCFLSSATGWCRCEGTAVTCYIGNSVSDCESSCTGDDSNDGNGNGNSDDNGPLEVANLDNWIIPDNGGSGNGNNTTIEPNPPWSEFCGNFDGSLPANPVMVGDEYVIDEATGTIALMNPLDLYLIQLQGFIDTYDLPYTPDEVLDMVGEVCAVSYMSDVQNCLMCHFINPLGLSEENNWYLIDNFEIVADCEENASPECVACEISITTFENQYGINLSSAEKDAIKQGVTSCLDEEFNVEATQILLEVSSEIAQLIVDNELVGKLYRFLEEEEDSEEAKDYVHAFLELKMEESEYKWDRFKELWEQTKTNNDAFLKDCILQNPSLNLNDYADLLNFEIPDNSMFRLDALGSDFFPQLIDEGNTPITNVDYYGIEITQMPNTDGIGPVDTQSELYDAIRGNFGNLASGSLIDFQSTCPPNVTTNASWNFQLYFPADDGIIWNSNNPETSIFFIDASASNIAAKLVEDDGAVITSQNDNGCCWVFSTISTPKSGSQPFSGNRQFGITVNDNGNYEFYTRAIDRAHVTTLLEYMFKNNECDETDYYNIAQATWNNFQNNVAQFINQNGGIASVQPAVVEFFDYEKIKDKLQSNTPVIFVSCH